MRRKPGALIGLETAILDAGVDLRRRDLLEFHGFLLAKELQARQGARLLTAYGTLYKALGRLESAGYLESRWEDPLEAAAQGRPRRRFYRVTLAGERALSRARVDTAGQAPTRLRATTP